MSSTYYWRIDEVNGTNLDGPWAGKVWSFTTGDFFVIEDFENYDAGENQIWFRGDPAAATIDTWTEWIIPLQAFADQGIVLTNVDRMAIGFGTQGNMAIPGGSGKMYIDDILLYQPG